jgi:hypothetical protein
VKVRFDPLRIAGLVCLLLSQAAMLPGQTKTIEVVVLDRQSRPVPGARV